MMPTYKGHYKIKTKILWVDMLIYIIFLKGSFCKHVCKLVLFSLPLLSNRLVSNIDVRTR